VRIRKEQIDAFAQVEMEHFVARMLVHLRRFFPEACLSLGDDGLLASIHHGITRAAEYGVVAERDVALYLSLMMALGRDFDRDPWAHAILTEPELREPARRMQRLYGTALERTRGADEHGG
jgi:hypothetical protein